ncbi:MAG: hypothetical protein QME96_11405, partial [Myxococcota bacterium]|nr:hypothetical protein [Myxococcota bacterium]
MRKRTPVERADRVRERAPAYRRSRRPSAAALVAAIEADPQARLRLAGLLGVPAGLPEALQRLADEMRAGRLAS